MINGEEKNVISCLKELDGGLLANVVLLQNIKEPGLEISIEFVMHTLKFVV